MREKGKRVDQQIFLDTHCEKGSMPKAEGVMAKKEKIISSPKGLTGHNKSVAKTFAMKDGLT